MARPSAFIDVKVNDRPAVKGIKRVVNGMASLVTVSAAGGAAVGGAAVGLAALSIKALAAADSIGKVGARVGLTAEQVSGLQHAAELGGAGAADLNTAMTALARRAAGQPKLFKKWGVSIRDANGQMKPTRKLLDEVAERIKGAGTQAEKLAIAQDLMSESGRKLVPALEDGAAGLAAAEAQADKLGVTLTTTEAKGAAALADRFSILGKQATSMQRVLGSALAPVVEAIGEGLSDVAGQTINWMRRNNELIQSGIIEALAWTAENVIPAIAAGVGLVTKAWYGWLMAIDFVKAAFARSFEAIGEGVGWLTGKMAALARFAGQGALADAYGDLSAGALAFAGDMGKAGDVAEAGLAKTNRELGEMERKIGDIAVKLAGGVRDVGVRTAQIGADFAASTPVPGAEPGPEGPTGDPDEAGEKAHKSYLKRLTERFKEETRIRRRALDLQLADIEAADKAHTEAQKAAAARVAEGWEHGTTAVVGAVQGIGQAIGELGGNAKGAVAAQKAFAVAAVAINTAVAVSRAYAELGPIAGTVAAVGLVAAGVASIARIVSTKPGDSGAVKGGTVSGGGGGGGTFRAPRNPGITKPDAAAGPQQGGNVVYITFNGPQGNPRRTSRELRKALAGEVLA